MTIGLCIAGYLLTVLIALFVVAYVDRILDPNGERDLNFYFVGALLWPVILLLMLVLVVVDIPLDLADRYARKHNLKKKETQS